MRSPLKTICGKRNGEGCHWSIERARPYSLFPDTLVIVWCERIEKADASYDRCRMFMGVDMFSKYFNEDCTVKKAGLGGG
jgi:hypothetical protein